MRQGVTVNSSKKIWLREQREKEGKENCFSPSSIFSAEQYSHAEVQRSQSR